LVSLIPESFEIAKAVKRVEVVSFEGEGCRKNAAKHIREHFEVRVLTRDNIVVSIQQVALLSDFPLVQVNEITLLVLLAHDHGSFRVSFK